MRGKKLVQALYVRNDIELQRGNFRVKGDTVDIAMAYNEAILRITFWDVHKDGAVFLANSVLTLLRREVGVHLQQFFAVYEMYLAGKEWLYLRIGLTGKIFRAEYGRIDAVDHVLEEAKVTLSGRHRRFPVPLV